MTEFRFWEELFNRLRLCWLEHGGPYRQGQTWQKKKKNTFMKHCEQMGFNTQEALMAY